MLYTILLLFEVYAHSATHIVISLRQPHQACKLCLVLASLPWQAKDIEAQACMKTKFVLTGRCMEACMQVSLPYRWTFPPPKENVDLVTMLLLPWQQRVHPTCDVCTNCPEILMSYLKFTILSEHGSNWSECCYVNKSTGCNDRG